MPWPNTKKHRKDNSETTGLGYLQSTRNRVERAGRWEERGVKLL